MTSEVKLLKNQSSQLKMDLISVDNKVGNEVDLEEDLFGSKKWVLWSFEDSNEFLCLELKDLWESLLKVDKIPGVELEKPLQIANNDINRFSFSKFRTKLQKTFD
jgi:hypothetical protein